MSDALDRIRARVEAHTAAAPPPPPVQPPAAPVADPAASTDLASQVADLNEMVSSLSDRLQVLEGAALDDTLDQLDNWAAEPMMAALPDAPTADANA